MIFMFGMVMNGEWTMTNNIYCVLHHLAWLFIRSRALTRRNCDCDRICVVFCSGDFVCESLCV